ncbi:MAG: cytochrome c-type biogenesis CcmF C-terminal domain-containing protein, partial [Ferruginibacter sp.]
GYIFILYSTYLTRTGILGDTSVHAFTEAGKAINLMILLFLLIFAISGLSLLFANYKKIPTINKEENTNSREFWMFIGSLVIFLTALFISAKTSIPVYNKIFNTKIAPPEDAEFSYNKIVVLVAIIIGILTAITQYFKYKSTGKAYVLKNIVWPTIIAAVIALVLALVYPYTFWKHGAGFLGAIYLASFACIYAVVANAFYIFKVLKGKLVNAGGSVAHAGFSLMIVGMLISAGNKEVISSSLVNGINLPAGKDPMTRQTDDPRENLTLIRQLPTRMGDYQVTYQKDSSGHEKGRKFYELNFQRKDPKTNKVIESFMLQPDVYQMKDNNMSSNPDTKTYLTKDVFTYITYALNKNADTDTSSFKVNELSEGDTTYYSNGMIILNKVEKNPAESKYSYNKSDIALKANITVISKDSMRYRAEPLILVDSFGINHIDDTVFAQNLYLRFNGVTDNQKIKIGVKESDKLIDFVTVKAYVFPFINLVWLGLIIMAIGLVMSMIKRGNFSKTQSVVILVFVMVALFYMFLLANQ